MKINKEFILKNLTAILSGIAILAMFLPFVAVEASASAGGFSASSGAVTMIGFDILGNGGFLGILLILCLAGIIASSYIPQLKQYRKFVLLGASVLSLICLIIVPSIIAAASNGAAQAGANIAGSAGVKVDTNVKFTLCVGFWIMLIAIIGDIAVSVIHFFGLKGNKIFDMVGEAESANTSSDGASMPKLDLDKFKGMAQNVAGNVKSKVSGAEKPAQQSAPAPQQSSSVPQQTTPQKTAPIKQNASISRDEILALIKELHDMKEAGILSNDEFEQKKKEYLEML